MSALTADDLWGAVTHCRLRLLEIRRTLDLLSDRCPPDFRQELEDDIAAETARMDRFSEAAKAAQRAEWGQS